MPKDCYKVVQWVYLLGVWNTDSRTSVFLSSLHSNTSNVKSLKQQLTNKQLNEIKTTQKPIEQQQYNNKNLRRTKSPNTVRFQLTENCESLEDFDHFGKLAKQQLHQYPKNSILQNSENKGNLNINFNNTINILDLLLNNLLLSSAQSTALSEVMDGGESTTSSNTSSILEDSLIPTATTKTTFTTIANQSKNNIKNENIISNSSNIQMENLFENINKNEDLQNYINTNNDTTPGTVYEEDDLISVISESVDSLYGVDFKLKLFLLSFVIFFFRIIQQQML